MAIVMGQKSPADGASGVPRNTRHCDVLRPCHGTSASLPFFSPMAIDDR